MHLSTNISHWMCVLMGLFLVVTGLVSHVHSQSPGGAMPVDDSHDLACLGKRAVLIAIGLVAVGYGVLRVLP
jgi:hypothetical protein